MKFISKKTHVAGSSSNAIFVISNTYNTYGYLEKILNGNNLIWQCKGSRRVVAICT